MLDFYPQIKWLHIGAVLVSGTLFLLRGVLVQLGRAHVANAARVRYLSYSIDTVLLVAALMLVSMLPGSMFANGWLTVKLVLLVAYIVLGSLALKYATTHGARLASFLLALLAFTAMLSIARSHQPLGHLQRWFG